MKFNRLLFLCLFCLLGMNIVPIHAETYQPRYSTAGFYELPETGRSAYSMNPAWRFHKGAATGAEAAGFDDSAWTMVSLPDGIE